MELGERFLLLLLLLFELLSLKRIEGDDSKGSRTKRLSKGVNGLCSVHLRKRRSKLFVL